jgi:drug/metabolite transporter (DMT)-like permease
MKTAMTSRGPTGLPLGALLLLAAMTVLWGINWSVIKIGLREIPPWTFRGLCLIPGATGMLLIARLRGLPVLPNASELPGLLLVALLNITGFHILSGYGVSLIRSGHAAIIAFTFPLWVVVFQAIWFGIKPAKQEVWGLIVGLAGILMLIVPDMRAYGDAPFGTLLMALAAMSWGAGTACLKNRQWSLPTISLAGWQLAIGGLPVLMAMPLIEHLDYSRISGPAILALIYSGFVSMGFCIYAWFSLVKLLPANVAGLSSLGVPTVGFASGVILLGERAQATDYGAIPLLLIALLLVLVHGTETPRSNGQPARDRLWSRVLRAARTTDVLVCQSGLWRGATARGALWLRRGCDVTNEHPTSQIASQATCSRGPASDHHGATTVGPLGAVLKRQNGGSRRRPITTHSHSSRDI